MVINFMSKTFIRKRLPVPFGQNTGDIFPNLRRICLITNELTNSTFSLDFPQITDLGRIQMRFLGDHSSFTPPLLSSLVDVQINQVSSISLPPHPRTLVIINLLLTSYQWITMQLICVSIKTKILALQLFSVHMVLHDCVSTRWLQNVNDHKH